jgi:hypothetical protein
MLVIVLLCHAGNGTTGVTWPWRDVDAASCLRRCCRVMLAMVLLSHAGNDTIGAT